jgi:hypothetical protein
MKSKGTVSQFIQLRAQGWTFDRIATEIHISKPTLIKWSREHQFDIQNLRAVETEALAEKCFDSRQQRWDKLGQALRRLEDELSKRDLASIPTSQLINLTCRLRILVARETTDPRFSIGTRDLEWDDYEEEVLDWQV